MSKFDVRAWLGDRNVLAVRLTDQDGTGFLRRRFHVPAQTVAFVSAAGDKPHVTYEGEEITGKFDAVLIKQGEAGVEYRLEGLIAKDEMPVTIEIMFYVQLESDEDVYIRDFCKNIFSTGSQFTTNDLKSYLGFDVRKVMGQFVGLHPVDELIRPHILSQAEGALRTELERTLFGKGLGFRKVGKFEASSRPYDRMKADRVRVQEKIERHEEALHDQDRRGERIKRLLEVVRSEDMQKMLDGVKDERLRGVIYAKLMGPDLRSLSALEMQERLSDVDDDMLAVLLRALTAGMAAPAGGPGMALDGIPATRSVQVFVVAGLTVLTFEPQHPERRGEFRFAEPLRSVRLQGEGGGKEPTARILAGGKATCFVLDWGGTNQIREYPLPKGKRPRGGINSAAVWGEELFATHSEYGLARWRLDKPGERAEVMFEELTHSHKTTRSVVVSSGGILFFASGSHLYSVDLNQRRLTPVHWKPNLQGSITSIDVSGEVVAVGSGDDASGSVVAWKLDKPDSGSVLVRKKEAVLGVHLTKIAGMPQVLFVTRDHGVVARVLGQSLETIYQSGEHALGLVDGASDFVCGVDTPGRRLFFWSAGNPQKPVTTVEMVRYAEHPVYDLKMLTAAEGG